MDILTAILFIVTWSVIAFNYHNDSKNMLHMALVNDQIFDHLGLKPSHPPEGQTSLDDFVAEPASELMKKVSKDQANLQGLGESE